MDNTPVEVFSGGTGSRLARATVIVSGVASLIATLLSVVSIWFQTKNYRKPLLQRYVVRILLMVPIYSISSWTSIVSLQASSFISPIRDIYEAFTIYTFFQLLINFLGGERALIITTHGRPPVQHAWPLNQCLSKVDISDPYTFLTIKRGILQYAWLKPILALIAIIMKATGTYQEGYLGLSSGYLWVGLVYNASVTISLYSLALFWVCMHDDLKPFRPIPKFLCVKLIIFASYWQGFFLSILQWLGALDNGLPGYSPDNLAIAIQDTLICFEMPFFAITHWHAFSWHDYADSSVSSARMPVKFALRDAFGITDLIQDTKETFRGEQYQYRYFDSGDRVMAHEESDSRLARVMAGMRYERGGKAKYWIPTPGEVSREANSRTPLLGAGSSHSRRPAQAWRRDNGSRTTSADDINDTGLDDEDERCYENARLMEFGDWNYPVITVNEAPRDYRVSAREHFSPSSRSGSGRAHQIKKTKRRSRRVLPDEERAVDTPSPGSARVSPKGMRDSKQQRGSSSQVDENPTPTGPSGPRSNPPSPSPREQTQEHEVQKHSGQTSRDEELERADNRDHSLVAPLLRANTDTSDTDSGNDQPDAVTRTAMGYTGAFDDERDAWNEPERR